MAEDRLFKQDADARKANLGSSESKAITSQIVDRGTSQTNASKRSGDYMVNVGKEGTKRQQESMRRTALSEGFNQREKAKTTPDQWRYNSNQHEATDPSPHETARTARQTKTASKYKGAK